MDEQESNAGHSGHGASGSLPRAPEASLAAKQLSDEDYRKQEYERARRVLTKAIDLINKYEEMGIPACEIPRVHSAVRSSFGYGP